MRRKRRRKDGESRYVRMARLAYRLAQQTVPRWSHPKSPHYYTFPQLVACVLLKTALGMTYRDFVEWLKATDRVCAVLELERIPHDSTLNRVMKRLRRRDLHRMLAALHRHLGTRETGAAADSTGFREEQASAYYPSRRGRRYRRWRKGVVLVGLTTMMVLAMRAGRGPGSDARFWRGLKRTGRRWVQDGGVWIADAGFDGHGVAPTDLIPPIRRGGSVVASERRRRQARVQAARRQGLYGQRWKSETVISVVKRKWGDRVTHRKGWHIHREILLLSLVYAMHRSLTLRPSLDREVLTYTQFLLLLFCTAHFTHGSRFSCPFHPSKSRVSCPDSQCLQQSM